MNIRSNIKSGQSSLNQATSAQTIVNDLAGSIQREIENMKIWSLIRVNGPGLSSWTMLSQKPESGNLSKV